MTEERRVLAFKIRASSKTKSNKELDNKRALTLGSLSSYIANRRLI
jgi:hypothetical protein